MSVTLHRFAARPTAGDLDREDLAILWGMLRAENLAETFFHDGSVTTLSDFIRYATDPNTWFYAAKQEGAVIGIGVVNNFFPSGNTAFVHLCSFAAGRISQHGSMNSPFATAGRQWFRLLHEAGGLETLIATFPAVYRGVRAWVEGFGFTQCMRLPGALRLVRQRGVRLSDALVYQKSLLQQLDQRDHKPADSGGDCPQTHSKVML